MIFCSSVLFYAFLSFSRGNTQRMRTVFFKKLPLRGQKASQARFYIFPVAGIIMAIAILIFKYLILKRSFFNHEVLATERNQILLTMILQHESRSGVRCR